MSGSTPRVGRATSVVAASHSSSELLTSLLDGPVVNGGALGRRDIRFGGYVVTLHPPGSARMPNGIECGVRVAPNARVSIGGGRLIVGRVEIRPGPGWDPVPAFDAIECLPPGPEPSNSFVSWIGSPAHGADVQLAGYLAGLVLLHGQRARAEHLLLRVIATAEPLSATLLRHAARGEVPQLIHELLASRNTTRLITSSSTGISWLRGLISAGLPLDPTSTRIALSRRTA